ncbi:uncharacterized protein LOC111019640 [Momordica charantia]|uniref:Uncharacterized protein LOC111019640 n=1 Tax=Momordica charantia TaxID=3673 RepID=A0A6J1DEA3_MOMCH|nr:uncharacterized protein LOC111019640 [Momordica charantia]
MMANFANRGRCGRCRYGGGSGCGSSYSTTFSPNSAHLATLAASYSFKAHNAPLVSAQPTFGSQVWLFDSSCNAHLTSVLANLTMSTEYNGEAQIAVGNGQPLPITHTGQTIGSNLFYGPSINGLYPLLAHDPVFHGRTKHIEVDLHFVCEAHCSATRRFVYKASVR